MHVLAVDKQESTRFLGMAVARNWTDTNRPWLVGTGEILLEIHYAERFAQVNPAELVIIYPPSLFELWRDKLAICYWSKPERGAGSEEHGARSKQLGARN